MCTKNIEIIFQLKFMPKITKRLDFDREYLLNEST